MQRLGGVNARPAVTARSEHPIEPCFPPSKKWHEMRGRLADQ